jgi:hypothetical protein
MPYTNIIPKVIRAEVTRTMQDLFRWVRDAARLIGMPPLEVRVSVGAEASNVRRATFQVINRDGAECSGLYVLEVWVSSTATGAPAGSQTITLVTGAQLQEITANMAYRYITGAAGSVVLDIDAGAGAQSRYIRASIVGQAHSPTDEPVTWT